MRPARLLLPIVLLTLVACATTPPSSPPPATAAPAATPSRDCGTEPMPIAGSLHAVAWMQHAAEYRALTTAMYRNALPALQRGVADRTWTAEVRQTAGFESLPPAVVMDLDETVLDNSAVQARLVRANNGCANDYRAAWSLWIAEASAGGVSGAVQYILAARRLRDADGRAVHVFFVTNRECEPRIGNADPCPQKAETLLNLRRLGLDTPTLAADTLLRNERADWVGDKQSRRDLIAREFRIVQLAGDDFGDFLQGVRDAPEATRAAARCRYSAWWGERWIVLPNPMYGSWQTALTKGTASPLETERPLSVDDCPQP